VDTKLTDINIQHYSNESDSALYAMQRFISFNYTALTNSSQTKLQNSIIIQLTLWTILSNWI